MLSTQQQGGSSKVHTNKSLVQSQYSAGGRQHDQSKATLLQQQVMRLQQLESMKGAGRQSTDVQSKHDQPVVASGNGMGVAYTRHHDPPHQGANKPLKRTSLPLPPPSSQLPSPPQHRSSLPVVQVRPRGVKQDTTPTQPHPLAVSQTSSRANKHVHNNKMT